MQQTKSYWRFMAVAGVLSAFIASACVVTTEDDDSSAAGAGGSGTAGSAGSHAAGSHAAGSSAAGAAAGSAGAAAGSGGVSFQCDPEGEGGLQGTPNDCAPQNPPGDACEQCIQAKCCSEYEACYAYNPGNQCGWGGPAKLPSGEDYKGGEALCYQLCVQAGVLESGTDPDPTLMQTCANGCYTPTCEQHLGVQTNQLIACLHENCSPECFGPPE